jgi:hypothetical protein
MISKICFFKTKIKMFFFQRIQSCRTGRFVAPLDATSSRGWNITKVRLGWDRSMIKDLHKISNLVVKEQ